MLIRPVPIRIRFFGSANSANGVAKAFVALKSKKMTIKKIALFIVDTSFAFRCTFKTITNKRISEKRAKISKKQ